jgi:transposase
MGNQFRVEVGESSSELQHRWRHAVTAASKERLQMLYWIKIGALATRQELSQRLGRDSSTVDRWLKRYKQGGIEALLGVKTPPGKSSLIPALVMKQLSERLGQPQGFNSYSQIQPWLAQEFQIVVADKTVHKIVRYKLKAKLKRTRVARLPRHREMSVSPPSSQCQSCS